MSSRGEPKEITLADVEAVIATTRQRSVFELANAIGEGSRERALLALGSLVGARESGVRIVAMVARHVRQLWTAHGLLSRRLSKFELAQALGVPPFFVDGIEAQARLRDRAGYEAMHAALFEADRALKSSRLEDGSRNDRSCDLPSVGPRRPSRQARAQDDLSLPVEEALVVQPIGGLRFG